MENKIQPLNYCRQIKKIISKSDLDKKNVLLIKNLLTNAVKFTLPEGGYFIKDSDLKGLDSDTPLNLPFKQLVLEYELKEFDGTITKNALVAEQPILENPIGIVMWSNLGKVNCWGVSKKPIYIDYVDRTMGKPTIKTFYVTKDETEDDSDLIMDIYGKAVCILCGFLNTLSCSNVKVEKLERRKPPKGKKMDALPFDEYHVLTVDMPSVKTSKGNQSESYSDRHSPREHLRRGHIRRLQDNRKIWVNAAVINAGVAGKIYKNYVVH
jgi:hypothetical protein